MLSSEGRWRVRVDAGVCLHGQRDQTPGVWDRITVISLFALSRNSALWVKPLTYQLIKSVTQNFNQEKAARRNLFKMYVSCLATVWVSGVSECELEQGNSTGSTFTVSAAGWTEGLRWLCMFCTEHCQRCFVQLISLKRKCVCTILPFLVS